MGTCYYFWRDDNQTAFELGKSGELHRLFEPHRPVILMPDYADTFADLWALECCTGRYGPNRKPDEFLPLLRAVAAEVIAWSEGQPIEFVSEHDGRIERASIDAWEQSDPDAGPEARRPYVTGTIYRESCAVG